jgi:hypothetical protein
MVTPDAREANDYREVFAFGREYLVFVDGWYREEDGALTVLLEQYAATPRHAEPICRTEEQLRQALTDMGASPEQAATTARLLWIRTAKEAT